MKSMFIWLLGFVCFLGFSCDDESGEINTSDPSNLAVTITDPEVGSGLVTIEMTADNAVEYEFDLGEEGVDIITNTSGTVTHTYMASGTYTVEVKAFGASGKFLKHTESVVVDLNDGTDGVIDDTGYSTPTAYDGMTMIWNDEFEGSSLDETYWNYEIGTGSNGWGNNELQYYREQNTSVDQGYLIIEARKESFNGRNYTSSRLTTQNKFDFQYGRVDIRAKLPKGQGIWPALWMLGENFNTVGWPYCGEVDIMEMVGGGEGRDDVVHGTVHWDNAGTKADYGGSTQLSSGIFNDEFHVFTITWDANSIQWYLDDDHFHTIDTSPADLSEFRNEFFFIFNVAVGGNWPGSPNASTSFPQQMIVDYIRVFQNE